MTEQSLTAFFGWMTVLNIGIYLFSAGMILAFRGFFTGLHARLFNLGPEVIGPVVYGWLGLYKLLIVVFCLVPYLALTIIA